MFNPCRLSLSNTEIKRIASMVGGTTEVDIRRVPVQSMIVDDHLKLDVMIVSRGIDNKISMCRFSYLNELSWPFGDSFGIVCMI